MEKLFNKIKRKVNMRLDEQYDLLIQNPNITDDEIYNILKQKIPILVELFINEEIEKLEDDLIEDLTKQLVSNLSP